MEITAADAGVSTGLPVSSPRGIVQDKEYKCKSHNSYIHICRLNSATIFIIFKECSVFSYCLDL